MRDIIIVDDLATVTPVSGSEPTISGETVLITLDRLIDDDFNFDDYLCSEDNLTFGKMESAHLEFTIINDKTIPYLQDMIIKVYEYTDGDSSTLRQIGRFTVLTDEKASDRLTRTINAYDDIYYLRDYDITEWYYGVAYDETDVRTVYDLRNSLFTWLNAEADFSISQQSVTLVNDLFPVYKGIESDVITFGFFMTRLLEFNGCFGHIGDDGTFNYVSLPEYAVQPVKTLTSDDIIPPVEFEDYKVWGIGFVDVYDRDNIRLYRVGSSSMKHPSRYRIIDSFIFYGYGKNNATVRQALQNLKEKIDVLRYVPFETDAIGDFNLSVGDRIDIHSSYTQFENDEGELVNFEFPTYILELHRQGIQQPFDTYAAKGAKKQPKYKLPKNSNWHYTGDTTATSGTGTGGVSELYDEHDKRLIQLLRNLGYRILDQPTVELVYNKEENQVEIKWTDPTDLVDNKPIPAEWAKTIVVRKEGKPPIHQWNDNFEYGGNLLVTSTTRDEYSENAYIDDTIESNKRYYYAIMPASLYLADNDNPIYHYNWTKVISVDTSRFLVAPSITGFGVDGTSINVLFTIPELEVGTYTLCKLVAKKDSIPQNANDGKVVSISPTATSASVSNLDELSTYYFVIFVEDNDNNTAESEAEFCRTGRDEGYNFAYTGSIQTFTAPKTGIYQLETWGAQGGDAEDSENNLVARGGYGAYAKGEVFLTQGETLYIGVGGQDGFNGGGNYVPHYIDFEQVVKNTNYSEHRKVSGQNTSNISFQYTFADLTEYYLSDWNLSAHPDTNSYVDGEFIVPDTYVSEQNVSNGFAIPIYNNRLIYGVKFDCKVVNVTSGSWPRQGFLELVRIDSGNTVTRIDLLRICRDPSTSYDASNPSHRLATDDLYHTYEFVFDNPVTFDYIHINGSFVDTYVKNIQLLV